MPHDRNDAISRLSGTWKLVSFSTRDLASGQQTGLFGAHPVGYLNYGNDSRMYAILVGEGRRPPRDVVPTDAERIALFSGLCSYAGIFSIEGDRVSHYVDVSWNEAWTGTVQVREFRIEGNRLILRTLPDLNPVTGRESVSELVWLKVEPGVEPVGAPD